MFFPLAGKREARWLRSVRNKCRYWDPCSPAELGAG